MELDPDTGFALPERIVTVHKATVILFKPSGKYYTEEHWRVPEGAMTPHDMARSPDYRTIGGGPVLVDTQEPWGFPALLLPLSSGSTDD